jgi:hypothetical protein
MNESHFDEMFQELSRQAEGLESMFGVKTPIQQFADVELRKAEEALEGYTAADVLRFPELQNDLAGISYRIEFVTLENQAERFGRLIDTEPAVLDVLNIVRRAMGPGYEPSYDREEMSRLPYHKVSMKYVNPGELLDLLEPEENYHLVLGDNPAKREEVHEDFESEGITEEAMAATAFLEDDMRAAAYEGIFRELYGERWEIYKEATGFESFKSWQTRIATTDDNPNEIESMVQAQIKLQD